MLVCAFWLLVCESGFAVRCPVVADVWPSSTAAAFTHVVIVISSHMKSQREQPYSRALSRAQAIVERLGGTWAEGFPDKPKRMHWRTYSRLYREYEDAQSRSWPPWLPKLVGEH